MLFTQSAYICCISCLYRVDEQPHVTQSPLTRVPQKGERADSMYSVDLEESGAPKEPSKADPCSREDNRTGFL
jgi:hypothetical protein